MNNRLSIPEIAGLLAEYTGKDKKNAERFLKEFVLVVREAAFQDKIVKIKGIGTFKVIEVQDRQSIDVNTGNRIVIPGHYKFSFTPDKELKDEVNKPFSFFETVEISDHVDTASLVHEHPEEKEEPQPEVLQPVPAIEEPVAEEAVTDEPVPPAVEEPEQEPEEIIEEPEKIEEEIIADDSPEPIPDETAGDTQDEDMRPGYFIPKVDPQPEPESIQNTSPTPTKSANKRTIWIAAILLIAIGSGSFFFLNRDSLMAWNRSNRDIAIVADSIADNLINEMLTASDPLSIEEDVFPDTEGTMPQEEETSSSLNPAEKAGEVITNIQIQPGSRLTLIALEYYGNKVFWVYLYEYNKDVIKDPNNIPVGTTISIPVPELYNINSNSKASIEKATLLQSQILSAL